MTIDTLPGSAPDPLEVENDALRAEVERLKEESDGFEKSAAAMSADVSRFFSEAEALRETISTLTAERDALREQLADAEEWKVRHVEAALVSGAEEEREACAREVEEYRAQMGNFWSPLDACDAIAAAIRARKP